MISLKTIPVYVVSVKTFVDRHKHMADLEKRLGIKFEYVWAYDADDLTDEDYARVDDSMSPKSVSNVLKHLDAQRRFLDSNASICMVLEDDVLLFDSFEADLAKVLRLTQELAPGWLVFLGGADNKIDDRFLSQGDRLIEQYLSTAEAYLLDRSGCQRRMEWLAVHKIDRQADHQIKMIDIDLDIKHYWFSRPLATQGSITGVFKTALDGSRSKRSANYLRVRFWWNRFRRQLAPKLLFRFKRFLTGTSS